ncbi:MAG: 16S rRNA (guanine(527)-N(7))-methyltransferase RsmG [candidate division NC10 bacterium]|nr:16S rRNA (guanine(527)-N(7))-methyltransferase RsmG [candidate division NC10 bacterium]
MDEKAKKQLRRGIARLNLPFTESQIESLITYLRELKRWNRRANLVGFRTDDALIRHGILDSLSLLEAFRVQPGLELMDIGSGAGFPGIPLKVAAPDLRVTLVEATRKKASFLRQVCRLLQLQGVSVLQARAEALHNDPSHREAYDLVTARAVARLPEAVTLCAPFMKSDGRLVLPVGPKWPREAETLRRPDLRIEGMIPASGDRYVLVMVKVRHVSRETGVRAHPESVP